MNLSLSIDDRTFQEASQVAEAMGKSLTQLIREHLARLTNRGDAAPAPQDTEVEGRLASLAARGELTRAARPKKDWAWRPTDSPKAQERR
jgi:hypothetical protein